MTDVATETPFRRPGLRKKWERLRHSDALRDFVRDFALWTALWTGFPLYDDSDLDRQARIEQP